MPLSDSINSLEAIDFWRGSDSCVVFDVRSPREYAQGHIPGAINLPLFSDAERVEIGTIFKNSGRDDAVLRGLAIVGPKMADLAKAARAAVTGRSAQVFVHCWRGGMRSQSMHWLLETSGLNVTILNGGYKAFRRLAHSYFEQAWPIRVVSGLTGAGKTRVLQSLVALGESVVDLEKLANHRGSAFGAIGQPKQPTTEQFENELFAALDRCCNAKQIWIEDEGNRLGTVVVPPPFVRQIRNAKGVFLISSIERRVENLMRDYGDFEPARLCESVNAIRKRLGFNWADEALAAIKDGEINRAIEIVLAYYDRTYSHAATKMPRPPMAELPIDHLDDQQLVEKLKSIAATD